MKYSRGCSDNSYHRRDGVMIIISRFSFSFSCSYIHNSELTLDEGGCAKGAMMKVVIITMVMQILDLWYCQGCDDGGYHEAW